MEKPKTLIGKNNILFLTNDSGRELLIHCDNLNIVSDISLFRYNFKNFMFFVYPDKSVLYKDFLPDNYVVKYRPGIEIYKNKLKDDIYDLYNILKDEVDVYYKTDSHINLKGNYIVYKFFIETINSRLNLKLVPKELNICVKSCILENLYLGIGDLTWPQNLGDQTLDNIEDNFYYSDELPFFYCKHKIKNDNDLRFLDYDLNDKTMLLENELVTWNIISKFIIYKKNNDENKQNNIKALIFYDSYLLQNMQLYFDIFDETYFAKNMYSNDLINLIKPDFVFEFRVERFLF